MFMQEMRQTRPISANKRNPEVQVRCALPRAEKEKYKVMKKEIKMADRNKLVEEHNSVEAEVDTWLRFLPGDKTRVHLIDVLSISKVRVIPEKEIKILQKFLSRDNLDLVHFKPDMVFVGLEAIARNSQDNSLCRCRVTNIHDGMTKVCLL